MATSQERDLTEYNKTLFCCADLFLSEWKTLLTTQHSLPEPILAKMTFQFLNSVGPDSFSSLPLSPLSFSQWYSHPPTFPPLLIHSFTHPQSLQKRVALTSSGRTEPRPQTELESVRSAGGQSLPY